MAYFNNNPYGVTGMPGSSMTYNPYNTAIQQQIPRVHGEEGAKAYQMAPNSSVLLQDETDNIVWAKVTDSAGFATIKGFFLTPIVDTTPKETTEYVTKKDFDELKKRFDELAEELK